MERHSDVETEGCELRFLPSAMSLDSVLNGDLQNVPPPEPPTCPH